LGRYPDRRSGPQSGPSTEPQQSTTAARWASTVANTGPPVAGPPGYRPSRHRSSSPVPPPAPWRSRGGCAGGGDQARPRTPGLANHDPEHHVDEGEQHEAPSSLTVALMLSLVGTAPTLLHDLVRTTWTSAPIAAAGRAARPAWPAHARAKRTATGWIESDICSSDRPRRARSRSYSVKARPQRVELLRPTAGLLGIGQFRAVTSSRARSTSPSAGASAVRSTILGDRRSSVRLTRRPIGRAHGAQALGQLRRHGPHRLMRVAPVTTAPPVASFAGPAMHEGTRPESRPWRPYDRPTGTTTTPGTPSSTAAPRAILAAPVLERLATWTRRGLSPLPETAPPRPCGQQEPARPEAPSCAPSTPRPWPGTRARTPASFRKGLRAEKYEQCGLPQKTGKRGNVDPSATKARPTPLIDWRPQYCRPRSAVSSARPSTSIRRKKSRTRSLANTLIAPIRRPAPTGLVRYGRPYLYSSSIRSPPRLPQRHRLRTAWHSRSATTGVHLRVVSPPRRLLRQLAGPSCQPLNFHQARPPLIRSYRARRGTGTLHTWTDFLFRAP